MIAGDGEEAFYSALLDDDPEQLYERAPCGYLSTTPDGTIIKVNQTFLELTGYRREALVGRRRFAELLTGGGRIYHETHYAPLLRMDGRVREIALDLVCADGRRRPVLVNSVLNRDAHGAPVVIRTAVFDATERREYERELLRAKRRAEESEAHANALARTLQRVLIPPTTPDIAGLDLAAVYRPAGDGAEVGGDFYDVFQVGVDDWVVCIGDVCGKGATAAVVTSLVRYTVRAATVAESGPAKALIWVNDVLLRDRDPRTSTVALARMRRTDPASWTVVLSCAGHPLPLRWKADGLPEAVGKPGTLLGAIPDPRLHDVPVSLSRGDLLVLFTDGVTEARDAEGRFYGDDRLADVISSAERRAEAVAHAVLGDVLQFQHDIARDDIAVVVLGVPTDL